MINVLYVFDDNYAPYAGISIMSLLKNNKDDYFTIYCCGMNVSKENKERIEKTVKTFNQEIVWINSKKSEEYINCCETGCWNGSKATWMKVFAPWELPDYVEKIVYLDSDTIVGKGFKHLYEFDLEDYAIGMVRDSLGNFNGKKNYGTKEYYNAGVFLLNVFKWKDKRFIESFIECLRKSASQFSDNDQGILNYFFKDAIKLLPLRFNTQGFLYLFSANDYLSVYNDFPFYEEREIDCAKNMPVVVHFFRVFGQYPWEKNNHHPNRKVFQENREESLWNDSSDKEKRLGLIFYVEYILYCILPPRIYLRLYRKIVERQY